MKRLGMLLVLVSVGMFTLVGCGEKKKTTPKKTGETPAAGATEKGAETPAATTGTEEEKTEEKK